MFGFLSGLLPLVGVFPYSRDILRQRTKPHRGSFFIWTILGSIAFFSQLAKGAEWSLFLPAADTIATLGIFILSLWYGTGGLDKRDMGALLLAVAGLGLWYFTKQPLLALIVVIGVDSIGTILTIVKTYKEPHSETFSSWLLASLGGLCAAFAVHKSSFALLAYPIYIFVANGSVNITMLLRRQKVDIPRSHSSSN